MAKVTEQEIREAVESSTSFAQVLQKLGRKQGGGNQSHLKRRCSMLGIDTSHFTGQSWKRGSVDNKRKGAEEILVLGNEGGYRPKHDQLKRAMLESGFNHECSKCGQGPEWMGNPLTLDIDHINEKWHDNRPENLRFLCPNCHSQFSRKQVQ